MKPTVTLLAALLLPLAASAQNPPLATKTIVTVSASTPELPRKSEGDVIELKDGRLLLVSMEFGGDGSDFATTRLVAHESADGGLTWGGHRVITETAPGDVNVYSPNLIRAQDGGVDLVTGERQPLGLADRGESGRGVDQGERGGGRRGAPGEDGRGRGDGRGAVADQLAQDRRAALKRRTGQEPAQFIKRRHRDCLFTCEAGGHNQISAPQTGLVRHGILGRGSKDGFGLLDPRPVDNGVQHHRQQQREHADGQDHQELQGERHGDCLSVEVGA